MKCRKRKRNGWSMRRGRIEKAEKRESRNAKEERRKEEEGEKVRKK